MSRICLNCFTEFSSDISRLSINDPGADGFIPCPISGCGGEVIEVDDLLAPVVMELNKKGYYTTSSCAGHINSGYAYIEFDKCVEELPTMPDDSMTRVLEYQVFGEEKSKFVLLAYIEGENALATMKNICNVAQSWYKWAMSLPAYMNDEDESTEPEIMPPQEKVNLEQLEKEFGGPVIKFNEIARHNETDKKDE